MSNKNWMDNFIIVGILLFTIMIAIIFFAGCAKNSKYVYVPQQCAIDMPTPPSYSKNGLKDAKGLAIYAQELECALEYCTKGKNTLPQCKVK